MNLHDQHLGTTFSQQFFAAMLHEGGRVESDLHDSGLIARDWIFTYLNF